jgi:hypothetical protein
VDDNAAAFFSNRGRFLRKYVLFAF